ncbi:methyltransferase domain-containing protein [Streptomyces sp. NPDC004959]|uniref:class I SAM-dependent methyltransferase n=1 Tax=unclassified Streptomyces TaxID=2593676 RepID=UPI00068E4C04|nr:methyltransferase domain-containing protein [Streptomyces sp. NRRL F-5630]
MTEAKAFDRVADDYDRMRGGMERGRQSAAQLAGDLTAGPVLEVGVGTGIVAAGLAELGHEVHGVDVSRPMLARAAQRLAGRVCAGDARALPFADGSFANLVFTHVLHLVGDMPLALREAARVLRPGGRLLAVHGDPGADPDELVAVLDRLAVLQPPRPDTPEGLDTAAREAGLERLRHEFAPDYERATTPRQLLESLERRLPPYLWDVGDEVWARVVEPALAALRELPDPDRPRVQRWRVHRSVYVKV